MAFKNFYGRNIIFFISLILGLFLYSDFAFAQATYNALVTIPGIPSGASVQVYLSGLYTFLISVVGIVAMGAIVIGGARYLTSAGNPSAIEDAKHTIYSAIIGLLLALLSWVIIKEINPDILVMKKPSMEWGATGYTGVADSIKCALPGGSGTVTAPCTCIDGAQVVSNIVSATATNLTLAVAPNPATTTVPGNSVTLSGSLTDANGAPIENMPVQINMINFTLNTSTTFSVNTDPAGNFNYNFTATCATGTADVKMQAVFAGSAIYADTGSNTVQFVVNGLTVCTDLNYSSPPLPIATLWSAGSDDICDQTCSDASKQASAIAPALVGYHCLGAKITVSGTNVAINPDGVSANMKVNGDVTIDGITASVFPDTTTKILSTYDWTIGGFTKINDTVGILYPSDTAGVFAAAGNYEINLTINTPPSAPGVPQDVTAKFTLIVTN